MTDPNTTDEAAPAEAEARGAGDVEYRGELYTFDPARLTWEVMEADARGDMLAVCQDLLGPEQYARFKTANPYPLELDGEDGVVVHYAEMARALFGAMGNLAASSRS